MKNSVNPSHRVPFIVAGLLLGGLALAGLTVFWSLSPQVEASNLELQAGSGKTLQVGLQPSPWPWKVQLEVLTEPQGALRATLDQALVGPGNSTPLVLSAPEETRPGEYSVTLRSRLGLFSRSTPMVVRVNPQPGSLDTSFGQKGLVLLDMGVDRLVRVRVLQNGKIMVLGWEPYLSSYEYLEFDKSNRPFDPQLVKLARLNADGSRDPGFGQGGMLRFRVPDEGEEVIHVGLSHDEQQVLVKTEQMLYFYNLDGSLNRKIQQQGELLEDPRGGFFIVGWNDGCEITRWLSSGEKDLRFGNNGSYRAPEPADKKLRRFSCFRVALDGEHLVYTEFEQREWFEEGRDFSMRTEEPYSTLRLVRLNPQGQPDPDFGDKGRSSPMRYQNMLHTDSPPCIRLAHTPQRYLLLDPCENTLYAFNKRGERDLDFGNRGQIPVDGTDYDSDAIPLTNGSLAVSLLADRPRAPLIIRPDGTLVDHKPALPSQQPLQEQYRIEGVGQDAQGRLIVVGLVGSELERDNGLKTDVYLIRAYP